MGSYFSIIKAIAAGNRKLGKIASVLETKQTSLTRYLKTLADLDILEREVPVTESNPQRSKSGQYRIKDNFLLFWFRYVFPNLGLIESGHAEAVKGKIERNFIDGHVSYVYERICQKRYGTRQPMALAVCPDEGRTVVGRRATWRIDAVALDDQGGSLALCECKFWKEPVGANVLRDLESNGPGRCLAEGRTFSVVRVVQHFGLHRRPAEAGRGKGRRAFDEPDPRTSVFERLEDSRP